MALGKPSGPQVNQGHPLVHGRRLVGAWLLTEGGSSGSGSYRDLSTTRAHGTPTNGPTRRAGRYGLETLFAAASSQYVTVGNPAALQITDNITISTSYKLATNVVMQVFAKDKDTGGRAYTLDIQNTGSAAADGVRFYINGGAGGYICVEGRTPIAGDDRNVVVQYRSSDGFFAIYINGTLTATATLGAAAIPGATANVTIGRREYSGYEGYFDGVIRYAYVWNSILTPGEIARHNADPFEFVRPGRHRLPRIAATQGGAAGPQTIALTRASETETARPLTVTATLTIALSRASESESARALTPALANATALGRATETESARELSPVLATTIALGRASETESARALTAVPTFAAAIGRVEESETARALAVTAALAADIGRASETEEARGVTTTLANVLAIGRASETEEARALVSPQVVAIGRASESEEARGVEIYVPSPPTTPPTPPPASSSGGIVSGGGPLQRISVSRNVTFKRAIAEALSEIRRDIKRKRRKLKHVEESAIDFEKEMANATLEYFTQGIFVPLETFHKNVMSEIVLNAQIEHDEEESELEILLMSLV